MAKRNYTFEQDGKLMKRCPRCEEVKGIDDYNAAHTCYCASCRLEVSREKRAALTPEQREKERAYGRARYHATREVRIAYSVEYKARPEVRERNRLKKRERMKSDPVFKLKENASSAIRAALKSGVKEGKTQELIGCSIDELKKYLEAQFTQGMSWDKIGHGKDQINIDHILPCALFDLTDGRHQRVCFNYTNLRPMWGEENRAKADKLDDGRYAQDLTSEQKKQYLTDRGFGHLFEGDDTMTCYHKIKEKRPSRQRAVIRDDGQIFSSMIEADRALGAPKGTVSTSLKCGCRARGYRFRYLTP